MRVVRCVVILLVLGQIGAAQSSRNAAPVSVSVCDLLSNPGRYEKRIVKVSGLLYAERHSAALGDSKCERVVVIRCDAESLSSSFADGLAKKRYSLDQRPFKVTVIGKFEGRVRARLGYVSRIDVLKVLDAAFVDE